MSDADDSDNFLPLPGSPANSGTHNDSDSGSGSDHEPRRKVLRQMSIDDDDNSPNLPLEALDEIPYPIDSNKDDDAEQEHDLEEEHEHELEHDIDIDIPLPPDSSDSKYSPSQATAEDASPVSVSETNQKKTVAVLGRAQAKKRLQAFSAAKLAATSTTSGSGGKKSSPLKGVSVFSGRSSDSSKQPPLAIASIKEEETKMKEILAMNSLLSEKLKTVHAITTSVPGPSPATAIVKPLNSEFRNSESHMFDKDKGATDLLGKKSDDHMTSFTVKKQIKNIRRKRAMSSSSSSSRSASRSKSPVVKRRGDRDRDRDRRSRSRDKERFKERDRERDRDRGRDRDRDRDRDRMERDRNRDREREKENVKRSKRSRSRSKNRDIIDRKRSKSPKSTKDKQRIKSRSKSRERRGRRSRSRDRKIRSFSRSHSRGRDRDIKEKLREKRKDSSVIRETKKSLSPPIQSRTIDKKSLSKSPSPDLIISSKKLSRSRSHSREKEPSKSRKSRSRSKSVERAVVVEKRKQSRSRSREREGRSSRRRKSPKHKKDKERDREREKEREKAKQLERERREKEEKKEAERRREREKVEAYERELDKVRTTRMPTDWIEYKKFKYSTDHVQDVWKLVLSKEEAKAIKARSRSRSSSRSPARGGTEAEAPLSLGKSLTQHPILIKTTPIDLKSNLKRDYPLCLCKLTKHKPPVDYGPNPLSYAGYFKSREEVFNEEDAEMVKDMTTIVESVTSSVPTGDLPKSQEWFAEHEQIFCPTEGSKGIVISHLYSDDDMDDLSLPAVASKLAAVVKPEKQKKVVSETETVEPERPEPPPARSSAQPKPATTIDEEYSSESSQSQDSVPSPLLKKRYESDLLLPTPTTSSSSHGPLELEISGERQPEEETRRLPISPRSDEIEEEMIEELHPEPAQQPEPLHPIVIPPKESKSQKSSSKSKNKKEKKKKKKKDSKRRSRHESKGSSKKKTSTKSEDDDESDVKGKSSDDSASASDDESGKSKSKKKKSKLMEEETVPVPVSSSKSKLLKSSSSSVGVVVPEDKKKGKSSSSVSEKSKRKSSKRSRKGKYQSETEDSKRSSSSNSSEDRGSSSSTDSESNEKEKRKKKKKSYKKKKDKDRSRREKDDDTSDGEPGDKDKRGGPPGGSSSGGRGGSSRNQRRDRDYDDHKGDRDGHHHKSSKDPDRDRSDRKKSSKHKKRERGNPQQRESSAEDENESSSYSSSSSTTGSSSSQSSSLSTRESFVEEMTRDPDIQFALKGMQVEQGEDCNNDGQRMIAKLLLDIENDDFNINSSGGGGRKPAGGDEKYDPFTDTDMLEDAVQIAINRQVNNNNKNTTNKINIKKTDPQKDESSSSSMSSSSSTESSDTGAQDLLKTFENDTLLDFVLKNNNDLSTENLLASISGPDATTTAAADNSISLLKDEKKVEQVVTLVPCALASPVIKAKLEVVEHQKQKPVLAVQKQHNRECLPQSEEVPGAELSLNSTEEKPNSKVVDGDHDHEKSGSLLQRESHHHPRLGRIPCKRSYSSSRSRSRSRSVSRSRSRSISPNYRRHNSRSRYSDSYEHDRWSHQQSYDRDRRNDRYRSEDRRSHYVNDEPHNYRPRDVVRGDKEIIHYDRLPRYERHRRPHSRDSPPRREYSSSSRHERERDRDRERSPEEYPRYPPHRRSRFDRGIEREYSEKDRLEFEKHFRDGCLDGNGRHSPDLSEKPITTICSLVGTEGADQHQQSSPPLRLNVADSTISDSELPDNSVLAYNNSIGGHEGNRANPSNLKEIIPDPELNNSQIRPDNISSGGYASSPKRLSLDERLEMEMGIKLQDEPSSLQHGFPHHRPNYSVHMGKQQKFPAVPSHGPGQSAARSSMLGPNWQNSSIPPTHVQGSYEAPPQPRQSQAIQLGDMLQVLPGEMPERAFTVTKENCKLNPLTVLQYATQVIRKEGDQVDPSKCVTIRVPVVPFKVPVFKHPEPQVYHESQPAQDEEELNRKQRRMELKKIAEKKKLREKKKLMLKKKILEKKMAKKLRAQALKAAENKEDAKKEESNSSLRSIYEKNEGNELEAADPEELKLLKEALTEVPTDVSEEGVESCKSEDLPSSEIIPPPDVVLKEEDEIPKPDDMKEADENEDETGGKGEPVSPPQPSSEPFPASACSDFIQPKGILVVAGFRERILSDKPSKAVKFMDGIHPGYGSSRSEGEEIHSPPPVPQNKVLVKKKEKRKKIKIKLKNDEKTKSKLEVLSEIDPNAPKRPPPPPPKTPYPYCPLGILYQFNPPYAVLYAQAVVEHEFEVTYTPSMEAPRDFSGQCDAVIVDDLLSVQNEKPKQSIPTITTPMSIHEPAVGAETASSWLVSQTTSSERHRRKKHRDREYNKSIDSEVKSADACSESRSSSRSSSSSHHSSHKSAHAQPIPTIVGVMPNSASKTRDFHPTKDIELAENDEGNPDIHMNIPTDTKPTGESSNSKNLISLSSHREELNIDLYPIQGGHEIQQPPLPYDEERKVDVCRTGSKRDENHRKESSKYHEDHRISRKHVDDHRHKHYENHRSDRHKHGIENHRADSYNSKHVENHRSENHHKNSDHKRQGKHGKGKRLEHDSGFKEAPQGKEANPNLIPISPSPTTLSRTTIPLPTNSPALLLSGSSSISGSPKQKNDSPVNETSVVSPDPGIIRIQPKLEDEDQKFSPIPIVSRAKPQIKIKMSTISFASTPTSLSLPVVKLMSTSASPVPVPKPQVSPIIPTRISTPPTAIISPVSINQMDTTGPPPTHVPPPVHINVPVLHKPTFDYYCQVNTGSNPPHSFPVATPVPPPTPVHIIPGGLPSGIDLTRPPPLTPSFNPIGDVSHVNFSPRKFTPTAPTRIPGNSNLTIVKCTNDLMTLVPPREIITDVDNLGEIPSTPPPPGTSP